MKKIKGVIWDMDGVIANTGPIHFKAWRNLALEKGVNLTEEEFRKTFGMRNPDILKKLFGELSEEQINSLSFKKEENFRSLAEQGIEPLPGVVELIQKFKKANFKQAIASSTPLENINLILRKLKISNFFETIVSDEDVTYGKPDPESFLIASRRLGLKPEECLVIEDSSAGVKAGKSAGMKVIAVTNTLPKEKLLLADLIVDTLDAGVTIEKFLF